MTDTTKGETMLHLSKCSALDCSETLNAHDVANARLAGTSIVCDACGYTTLADEVQRAVAALVSRNRRKVRRSRKARRIAA